MQRLVRLVLLGSGIALLGTLIARIGPATVLDAFSRLSWRLALIVCFPFPLMTVCDALGWRFAFPRDRVPLRVLLPARLAGEAFNLTTPTASVGGEAVKAWLLRGHVPLEEGVASVIVAKTTVVIAQALFLLVGVAGAWVTLPPGSELLRGMEWLLGLEVVATGGFVLVQLLGAPGWVRRGLDRLRFPGARVLGGSDGALSRLSRREPRRLALSIASHLAGWMLGGLEAYVILRLLGLPVPWVTAVVLEAFGTAVRFATFWVPTSLGILEGGQVAAFAALGLGTGSGLSFVLVRRVREAAWVGIGFLALAAMRPAAPAPASGVAGA